MSTASVVRFSELTGLCEKIGKCKKSFDKQSLLNEFIFNWREFSKNINCQSSIISLIRLQSFYPAMRLLLPSYDKHRHAYGIRESVLAQIYCDILCLTSGNSDAQKLINFKSPKYSSSRRDDFADIVYDVLKTRMTEKGSVTIDEINNRLDSIAEAHGQSRKDIIRQNLIYLFQNMSALDQKWLIRIILKDVNLGLSSKTICHCFHPSSEDFYNVTNDLEAMCDKFLFSPIEGIKQYDIELFKAFKPMLSNRIDIEEVLLQMDKEKFISEIKFDGERVQLHKNGSQYRYWSRNGKEWTDSYGESPTGGTLTPFIHSQFKSCVENCILDGEMMGYNILTNTIGSKAENFDVKHPNIQKFGYMPCFIIFDIIYFNNEILTQRTLLQRKDILQTQILESELEGKIQIAKWSEVNDGEACLAAFNSAIENCEEGLIVKLASSVYKVNSRTDGWIKLKPDYVLGLHEELDCVIIGGYFGLKKTIHTFLCAIRSADNPYQYFSFTKVGTGYNRKLMYDFNLKMCSHWRQYKKEHHPSWLILSPSFREKPDVLIDPENSFIIQLKAAEIVSTDKYATGCTLRFARIDCFRDDKSPTSDCMSIDDLNKLRFAHKGKLALHPLDINFRNKSSKLNIEKSNSNRVRKRFNVAESFRSTVPRKKLIGSENTDSIFSGKEFCILLSNLFNSDYDKKQLEEFAYSNGGTIVQNPSKSTFAVIANTITVKIKNLINSKAYDIISADWMMECMKEKKFIEIKPCNYFYMKKQTIEYYTNLYDASGDSYTNELSEEKMRNLLKEMDSKLIQVPSLSSNEKSVFLDKIMMDDLEFLYLNGCVIYFHINSRSNYNLVKTSELERLKYSLILSGAVIEENIDSSEVTHVVLTDIITKEELIDLHALNRKRDRKFYLVSLKWVSDSIESGARINERLYFWKSD